ncbi:hypothetical protein ILYODFUR_039224 [Ilyodon furcidens]|uniref:Uncharacterized protein n=1 Tax=Ilyodon furcidens TaxID=33524 RepID=A0ABV0U1E7_9TELE
MFQLLLQPASCVQLTEDPCLIQNPLRVTHCGVGGGFSSPSGLVLFDPVWTLVCWEERGAVKQTSEMFE